jgi:hypothetical protein
VVGGFEIVTRVPAREGRNLRYVIAHECAHTFFYEMSSERRPPVHRRDALEEPLCNFGARELLLPRRGLALLDGPDFDLKGILAAARRYDVLPQWVAMRLLVDRPSVGCWFCVYHQEDQSTVKVASSEVMSPGFRLDLRMQGTLRRIVSEHAGAGHVRLERMHLASERQLQWCSVEIQRESADLVGSAMVSVLVRPV